VYRSKEDIPESRRAPSIALTAPPEGRDRLEVRADVGGSSFYEITFEAQAGNGPWQRIGTDDNAPYRVFHDVAALAPGTPVRYRATVLDNDRHSRTSAVAASRVAEPQVALEAPNDGSRVRGEVEVRATAVPEGSHYVVTVERSVDGGPFTPVATDDSSPVYTAFDDTADLADGAEVSYRAVLTYAPGRTVTSATRTVTVVRTPVTTAIVHYHRPAGDYLDWGLHLFGDAMAPGVATDWGAPRQRAGLDAFGAVFEVPLGDDTKRLSFIVHRPLGDTVADTREPGGDRSFVPLEHPEIWLKAGDPAMYFAPPPTG
jgi:alpha-amylase